MNWCNWWPFKLAAQEPPKPPPLCRDCRHMMLDKKWLEKTLNDPENAVRFSRCERTISIRYVGWDGEAWCNAVHCGTERLYGKCGKQGKFWAPKEN